MTLYIIMYFLNEKQIDTIAYYPARKGTDLREAHGVDQPSKMLQEEVQVSLPRFKMAETYGMVQFLHSMGMENVF